MSEDEIILLQDFVNGKIKPDKLEHFKGSYKLGFFYLQDIQNAIKRLLDLYQKEKEKNKELSNLRGKIREKIKELEDIKYAESIEGTLEEIKLLKELLEENNGKQM